MRGLTRISRGSHAGPPYIPRRYPAHPTQIQRSSRAHPRRTSREFPYQWQSWYIPRRSRVRSARDLRDIHNHLVMLHIDRPACDVPSRTPRPPAAPLNL